MSGKRSLDNRSRSRDLAPVYWNAQRRMRTSPAAKANQHVGPMLVAQLPIDELPIFARSRAFASPRNFPDERKRCRGCRRRCRCPLLCRQPRIARGRRDRRADFHTSSDTAMGRTCRNPSRARAGSSRLLPWWWRIRSPPCADMRSSAADNKRLDDFVQRKLLQHQQWSEIENPRPRAPTPGMTRLRAWIEGRRDKAQSLVGLGVFQIRRAPCTRSR